MKFVFGEIGSEFWQTEHTPSSEMPVWENYKGDKRFFASGRTALYEIIADIKKLSDCKKAYLPSYCCDSMVEPFLKHGIHVDFYEVYLDNGIKAAIDPSHSCDIILTVDYFGFSALPNELPNAVHIHDVTHSLLSVPSYLNADYYFASLRKWGAVASAGFASKTYGAFTTSLPQKEHTEFLRLRKQAYLLKAEYIYNQNGEKDIFLNLFNKAEELLDNNYAGFCADEKSLSVAREISFQKSIRKENATLLTCALKKSQLVSPIFSEVKPEDTPLFVPVVVKNNLRDKLRRFLIENSVYCPVHWPEHSGISSELYKTELSLICDYRYSSLDIQREIELILAFEEKEGKK